MSTDVIKVMVPQRIAAPRGAQWAALAVLALRQGLNRLRRATRAEHEPQNAEELLDYAFRIQADMPGLAADLRAAALRHQGAELNARRISLTAPASNPEVAPARSSGHLLR